MTSSRFDLLQQWAQQIMDRPDLSLMLISGDASFRKYYRAAGRIWVDAPPSTEKNREFIDNAALLKKAALAAPEVFTVDFENGFLSLSDLGDISLLSQLTPDNVGIWYNQALGLLPSIAKISHESFPKFDDEFMARENSIFPEWLLQHHLKLELSETETALLADTFQLLSENNLSQPQVTMHRDFHSRNLMVLKSGELAVIDFQDMVVGPLTYDAVSLLKDCYCRWPDEVIEAGLLHSYFLYQKAGLLAKGVSLEQFWKWFDLTGMQRHLKAAGIFTRLNHRDGKTGYMKDIPRTLGYVVDVAEKYEEFQTFSTWLKEKVLPHFSEVHP